MTTTIAERDAAAHSGRRIDVAASVMAWVGVGHPHEPLDIVGLTLHPGDLLVEVELATICGSDLHTVAGHRRAAAPLVLGHEAVGRVVEIGEAPVVALDGSRVVVGDRITWSLSASCGTCARCEAGLPQKCERLREYGHERIHRGWELSGAFATHVHVLAGTPIAHVDAVLPAAVAAPASCTTATVVAVLEAATRVSPLSGATVVITGAGMLGLTAAAMAHDAHATVVVSDPDPRRRALALRFGAVAVADPGAHHGSPLALDVVLAGLGARSGQVSVGLELSGAPSAVAELVAVLDVGGVIVLAGSVSPGRNVPVDPRRIVTGLVTIVGVHHYAPRHLGAALRYLVASRHRWAFGDLVGHTVPLSELDAGLAFALTGATPRVAVRPGAAGAAD